MTSQQLWHEALKQQLQQMTLEEMFARLDQLQRGVTSFQPTYENTFRYGARYGDVRDKEKMGDLLAEMSAILTHIVLHETLDESASMQAKGFRDFVSQTYYNLRH